MDPPTDAAMPLWWDGMAVGALEPPDVPAEADVVIVGGGFTGLWTAWHLLSQAPSLGVVVLEAVHVGFGASGRNGGWVSALWPVTGDRLCARYGLQATLDQFAALRASVDDVGSFARQHAPSAGYVKGGALLLARTPAQVARARTTVAAATTWGSGTQWLDAGASRERLATDALGATFDPDCARIQPRALIEGLASQVRTLGGVIAPGCRVSAIRPGVVDLEDGRTVRSRAIVRATEAWSSQLPTSRRAVAPVYSLMVATEPLPPAIWAKIGLQGREVFGDYGHVVIYGQRTVDDRLAFGGRGAPYHWASAIAPAYDRDERVFAGLRSTLRTLLPELGPVAFTHAWGGPLGIARDWHPSVHFDTGTGLGSAGGYVGDGVAAAQLAGATLADLILRKPTPLTRLPWVGHASGRWEVEPWRWLGINGGLRLAHAAERAERRSARPAVAARLLARLTGH